MMSWLSWSNSVAIWWVFLALISVVNMVGWFSTRYFLLNSKRSAQNKAEALILNRMIWFSGAYVFGCAFRSFLPRVDVQRICLYDSWFSSVFIGRSVATVAELCFAAQWALILRVLSGYAESKTAERISFGVFPTIFLAEIFSWYAVISTNYLGNTIEESLWMVTFSAIIVAWVALWPKFKGAYQYAIGLTAFGCGVYVMFMALVDVPMYFNRWRADEQAGKLYLSFFDGLRDLNTRWTVTTDIELWKNEIPWMTTYFALAVMASIVLIYLPISKVRVSKYLR